MKNFWIMMSTRWSRDDLADWSSFRKTAYLLWPLLIYFIAHDIAQFLLWMVLGFLTSGHEKLAAFLTENMFTVRGAINGTAILTGVVIIWKTVLCEIAGEEKTDKKPVNMALLLTRCFLLTAIAFLAALGLNLLLNLTGLTSLSKSYTDTSKAQYGVNFIAGLFLYGVISPFAEEAVFRGLIYNRMKRCFHNLPALIVSSLLFGCYHGNLVQAVYGTLLGLLIAWCYEKSKSFTAPVLVHSIANAGMYVMTYYGVFNGMSRPVSIGVMIAALLGAGGCLWYYNVTEYF